MKLHLRVTLVYAVFGVLWIFLSDRLVAILTDNLEGLTFLQTMKGGLFVVLSSVLIFVFTKRAYDGEVRTEQDKMAVFDKTVEGSCHILLNYLNQMQLVTLEAEQSAGFDRNILKLANTASEEAITELKKLADIRTITAEHIDAVVYERIRNHVLPKT